MQTGHEPEATRVRRQGRSILAVAVVLTLTMFVWQGYHLYASNHAASQREIAARVAAVHDAGEAQLDVVDELGYEVLVAGRDLPDRFVADWAARYTAATAATRAAVVATLADADAMLTGPVALVEVARSELDGRVDDLVRASATANPRAMRAALSDPAYLAALDDFERATDSQIVRLAADLETRIATERSDEFRSVAIATALFLTAIGAWAVFARNLRRGRARLAAEHDRRLEAEAEVSQAQKMEALGLMADGIAHDVKNLTGVILGSVGDVRSGLRDAHESSTALTRIEDATRQADDLARSLLAFSRKRESAKGAVDLAALAIGMTQLLRYLVPPPVELTVEAPEAAWVNGDPIQLQQVILNLAANARDAMPTGGRLALTVREAPATGGPPAWLLTVADSGEGMAPDVVARIFDPFFTTRPAGQGSGLGLAIVRRTVADHGGSIDVSTRPGDGTTFTIRLPAVASPNPAADPGPQRGTPPVLVAHPVQYIRELIKGVLVANGYSTVAASTVDEIRTCFDAGRAAPGVAVVDAGLFDPAVPTVPADVPVVLIGPAPSGDVTARDDVRVIDEPLSLASVTDAVAELSGRSPSLVAS